MSEYANYVEQAAYEDGLRRAEQYFLEMARGSMEGEDYALAEVCNRAVEFIAELEGFIDAYCGQPDQSKMYDKFKAIQDKNAELEAKLDAVEHEVLNYLCSIEELKAYMQYYREGVQYEQAKAIIESGEQE